MNVMKAHHSPQSWVFRAPGGALPKTYLAACSALGTHSDKYVMGGAKPTPVLTTPSNEPPPPPPP